MAKVEERQQCEGARCCIEVRLERGVMEELSRRLVVCSKMVVKEVE